MSGPSNSATGSVARFFVGSGLPVFLLSAAAVYEAFLVGILLAPESLPYWGDFARDFKVWCFSYDPRTGGMEWAAAWIMLVEPAFIAGIAAFLWRRQLGALRRLPWRPTSAGAMAAAAALAGLAFYGGSEAEAAMLPFPGASIRTRLAPPEMAFVDHKGRAFKLADQAGKVTLITGVYALCSATCPAVLQQVKGVWESLPEAARAELSVVALSLDPGSDTPELRDRVAEGYGFAYPNFRYLNGETAAVLADLQRLGFSRAVDDRTGEVAHSNLFLLLDAEGLIAYRFGMGERQREWLREAALSLLEEARR